MRYSEPGAIAPISEIPTLDLVKAYKSWGRVSGAPRVANVVDVIGRELLARAKEAAEAAGLPAGGLHL